MQLHCCHHSARKYSDSVSIIIPVYNEEQRLVHSLKVLIPFCQSHFFDFEIICVDDGSTDKTWKIIEQLCIAGKLGFTAEKLPVNLTMQGESKIRLFNGPSLMLFELVCVYLSRNRLLRR